MPATTIPAASGQFRQCQPVLASSRRARNAPIAASAWFAAASLPTPDTKPCGIPCQTSTLASTPAVDVELLRILPPCR
jgi:hypothetical protein